MSRWVVPPLMLGGWTWGWRRSRWGRHWVRGHPRVMWPCWHGDLMCWRYRLDCPGSQQSVWWMRVSFVFNVDLKIIFHKLHDNENADQLIMYTKNFVHLTIRTFLSSMETTTFFSWKHCKKCSRYSTCTQWLKLKHYYLFNHLIHKTEPQAMT